MKPKHTKYKRYHSPRILNKFNNKGILIYSNYAIIATESSLITGDQLEAVILTIKRTLKRRGKIKLRVFPHRSRTKKGLGLRMGKGKGKVDDWLQPVLPGSVILELCTESDLLAMTGLRLAKGKLGFKTRIIIQKSITNY